MKIVLDVSNIVYGGYHASPNYRVCGFPMGGVRKLLGMINAEAKLHDIVLCFDGGATMKKELLPEYKAGRVPNYAVAAQLDLLREILDDCSIPYYHGDGIEADDYICGLVHFLSTSGDRDVVQIYSDDRDMACCVSDSVSIHNVTSNGKCINRDNYDTRVVSGETIPYNTILLHKMLFGDKSDGYGGITLPGLRFDLFSEHFLSIIGPVIEQGQLPESSYMDVNVMNIIIDALPDSFDVTAKEALKRQAKLVFPQLVDVTLQGIGAYAAERAENREPPYKLQRKHLKVFGLSDIDRRNFDYYCNTLGLNKCHPERSTSRYTEKDEEFKNLLKLRAKELSSGVTAVERYHRRKAVTPVSTTLENMELPI